jgi:hypothetical protein
MRRTSRLPGWRSALNAHIEAHRNVCHSYDRAKGLDCSRWTASGRFVVSGIKYPIIEKGTYKTERGALAYIVRNGCETVDQLAEKTLGPRIPISFAAAGDAVLADLEKMGLAGGLPQIGLVLGICNGASSYFVGETGLIELPTLALECCFYG